jgi:hypothetical protein
MTDTPEAESATVLIGRWAALRRDYETAKATRDALRHEMDRLAPDVIVAMATDGVAKLSFADGSTVYTQTTIRASAVDHDRLAVALEAAGVEGLAKVTVNANSLAAWVREQVANEATIPDEIASWIKVTEIPELRMRGGGAR